VRNLWIVYSLNLGFAKLRGVATLRARRVKEE
jgi:hypothetical protein